MTKKYVDAWWFSSGKTLPHDDGRRIKVGRTHKVKGEIIPCRNGLHGSIKPLDALAYAPGPLVWRVRLSGLIVPHNSDKIVASERTYIAGDDATETLRHFARLCALDVIDLWDAPDIVRQYLKTGDESMRAAARDAARNAAWAATRAATRAAARAAARNAARAATRNAAWDAARDAAWAAARAAARDAAWAAARAAARNAAWDAQNRRLSKMLKKQLKKGS